MLSDLVQFLHSFTAFPETRPQQGSHSAFSSEERVSKKIDALHWQYTRCPDPKERNPPSPRFRLHTFVRDIKDLPKREVECQDAPYINPKYFLGHQRKKRFPNTSNMRRVSSRQRLVSWDSFDATNKDESYQSSSDEEYSDYDTPAPVLVMSPSLQQSEDTCRRRKRERVRRNARRSRKNHGPKMVASYPWEVKVAPPNSFDGLVQDAHLHILSFLDVESIRSVMGINHKFRQLLFSSDSRSLWLDRCLQQWKNVPLSDVSKLVDEIELPTAAGTFDEHNCNLPLLLSMTPDTGLPTRIDRALFDLAKRRWRSNPNLEFFEAEDGSETVRYTGQVGAGDRCIRSDQPLPRPQRRFLWKSLAMATNPSLLDLFCRGAKAVSGLALAEWRPFVLPYVGQDSSIRVTPSMVAYFEVTISSNQKSNDDGDGNDEGDSHRALPSAVFRHSSASECVAVGVATESFRVHSRMPGWDAQSFGYHGDDGGIFHASGGMVERFGPCFGSGDTVGCGIDYISRGIFFTLNGKFLGYAWKGVDAEFLQNNLYPVVGIDTKECVSLNFGARPFTYDLSSLTRQHASFIAANYQLDSFARCGYSSRFSSR